MTIDHEATAKRQAAAKLWHDWARSLAWGQKPSLRAYLLAAAADPILAEACRPFEIAAIPTLKGKRHGRARR